MFADLSTVAMDGSLMFAYVVARAGSPKPATAAPCNNRRRLTGECIGLVEGNKSHGSTSTGCRRPREVDTVGVESLAFQDPQSDLLLRPSFEEPMHQGFVRPT
jgi:hypothetical protein